MNPSIRYERPRNHWSSAAAPPIEGEYRELAAPADALAEPLEPLSQKPKAAATLSGGVGSGVDAKGIELLKRARGLSPDGSK